MAWREGGQPVGVLILCEMPENAAWDLSYLGVIAEARSRDRQGPDRQGHS